MIANGVPTDPRALIPMQQKVEQQGQAMNMVLDAIRYAGPDSQATKDAMAAYGGSLSPAQRDRVSQLMAGARSSGGTGTYPGLQNLDQDLLRTVTDALTSLAELLGSQQTLQAQRPGISA